MRDPLSKKIIGIAPSGIRKFFDIVSEMPDAISLGVGEPDFDTPWRVREEGIYTLEKGRTFYTSNAGLKELRQEICNYLDRKIHVRYDYWQVRWDESEPTARVVLRYKITPDGETVVQQELESTDNRLKRRVLKAVAEAPRWHPAQKNGAPVESEGVLSIQLPEGRRMPRQAELVIR